ncbi:hypothetical protein [Streptomyces sp. NBC_01438]|uniref:hypothetical protein n=1 Tax=Streptomyces sp. NBC_01438 TaxID=2903866 RepID=UPI00352D9DB6
MQRGHTLHSAAPAAKNRLLGNSGSIEFTIQLPTGSRIEAKAAGAGFRDVGRLGDVTFEGAQGTVDLRTGHGPLLNVSGWNFDGYRATGTGQFHTAASLRSLARGWSRPQPVTSRDGPPR